MRLANFLRSPIDARIVVREPGHAKDEVTEVQLGSAEVSSLCVGLDLEL
jgi:hypothetical protein